MQGSSHVPRSNECVRVTTSCPLFPILEPPGAGVIPHAGVNTPSPLFPNPRAAGQRCALPNLGISHQISKPCFFFVIKMYILSIFSFFHPKLATEKLSQGCPSPSQVLPAPSQLCLWSILVWSAAGCAPHTPFQNFPPFGAFHRDSSPISMVLQHFPLPGHTVSVQHGASAAGWCCLCPTAACGHVPTGSPPGLSGGLAAPGGQQVPSALPKSQGGILAWRNWGAVGWPECCWRLCGAMSCSGQPTAPPLPPCYLPNSGKMGIKARCFPTFPSPGN